MQKASKQMRIWFLFFGIILWLGIYLSGFDSVHWLLYGAAGIIILAAITGICPGQILINRSFAPKNE